MCAPLAALPALQCWRPPHILGFLPSCWTPCDHASLTHASGTGREDLAASLRAGAAFAAASFVNLFTRCYDAAVHTAAVASVLTRRALAAAVSLRAACRAAWRDMLPRRRRAGCRRADVAPMLLPRPPWWHGTRCAIRRCHRHLWRTFSATADALVRCVHAMISPAAAHLFWRSELGVRLRTIIGARRLARLCRHAFAARRQLVGSAPRQRRRRPRSSAAA